MKKIWPAVWVAIALFIAQIACIWYLYPTEKNLQTVEIKQGLYLFDGGAARTPSTTSVNGERVFCGVSFVGPVTACSKHFHNQTVQARIVNMPSVFGPSPAVVEIRVNGTTQLQYTEEEIMELWRDLSFIESLRWSAMFTMAFSGLYQLLIRRSKK